MKRLLVFALFTSTILACKKSAVKISAPEIIFTGINKNTIVDGNSKDTLLINLRYRINADDIFGNNTIATFLLSDSRDTGNLKIQMPSNLQVDSFDDVEVIGGSTTLIIPTANFIRLLPSKPQGDTMYYKITLSSASGAVSNEVNTSDIYILP